MTSRAITPHCAYVVQRGDRAYSVDLPEDLRIRITVTRKAFEGLFEGFDLHAERVDRLQKRLDQHGGRIVDVKDEPRWELA